MRPFHYVICVVFCVRTGYFQYYIVQTLYRSWDKVYVVLRGGSILLYKDQKNYKLQPEAYFRGENPVDVSGCTAEVASDYTKRKHIFRLK